MPLLKDIEITMQTAIAIIIAVIAVMWTGINELSDYKAAREKTNSLQLAVTKLEMEGETVHAKLRGNLAAVAIRLGASEASNMVVRNDIGHMQSTMARIEKKLDKAMPTTNGYHKPE